jgi:hypothetical protein
MLTKFWLKDLKETGHAEDLGIDGEVISDWMLGNNVNSM